MSREPITDPSTLGIYLQDQTYDEGIDAVVEEIKYRLQALDGLLSQHCIDINVYVGPGGGAAQ